MIRAAVVAMLLVLGAAHAADAKGCHETSHVVGREHCTRFGLWSRDAQGPAVWVDLGYAHRSFLSEPVTLDGGGASSAAVATTADLGTSMHAPISQRVLVGIGRLFYAGGDVDAGMIGRTPRSTGLAVDSGGFADAHAIGGAHVALWRISFGVELAGGGRLAFLEHGCGMKTCPAENSALQDRLELEGRATVDLWMTPNVSLGFGLGHSLIDEDDTRWMVYLGGHMHALDGMY